MNQTGKLTIKSPPVLANETQSVFFCFLTKNRHSKDRRTEKSSIDGWTGGWIDGRMDGRHTDGRICRCCGPIRFDSVVVLAMRTFRGSKAEIIRILF